MKCEKCADMIEQQAAEIERLQGALTEALDWCEELRESGDAGIGLWKDDFYTRGRAALSDSRAKENDNE